MIDGLVSIYPGLVRLSHHNVVLRHDFERVRKQQVALVSGGGSGHEPAHAGYVGEGMLTAAVAGEVFSSPSPDSIIAAIRAVAGAAGVLLIVKNYTGDRLNFGLAAEMARAEGIRIEMVVVADDIALLEAEQYAGARGIAGTVLVHKIAGAAAAEGRTLTDVAALAREAAASVSTMGIALAAGILPGSGKPTFVLPDDEIEFGLGIHGEPGVARVRLRAAKELAEDLVERLTAAQNLKAGESIALMINNLGSTTPMELAIFARSALAALAAEKVAVERVYAGAFMTSLDAAGVSLSSLRVDDERLRLLDAPTSAPAWPLNSTRPPRALVQQVVHSYREAAPSSQFGARSPAMGRAIEAGCEAILRAEPELTTLDQASGDGDLGFNLARGVRALKEQVSALERQPPAQAVASMGRTLQNVVGGSSGALYGILFFRAASALAEFARLDLQSWGSALQQACAAVSEAGGATSGDRTMLDALVPFATALLDGKGLELAAEAATAGADETADLVPRRGRSSYLRERALGHKDPGAVAAAIWLRAVASSLADSGVIS